MYKLREIKESDLETINTWRNDKDTVDCLGAPFRYITYDVDHRWYENYLANRNTTVRCAVVEEPYSDNILGLISLCGIDNVNKSCELHLQVSPKHRHKGVGRFAVEEIIKHAFNNLNMNRIELSVLESNEKALKLYESVGFVKEGLKRQSTFKNGRYENMAFYSLLADEYKG